MRSRKRVNNVGIVLHVCIVLSESFIVSLAISLSINILVHVACVITARTFVGVSAINLSVSITSVLADRLSSRLFTSVTLEEDIRLSSPMNLFSTSGCIRFLEIDLRFRVPR